MYHRTAHNKSCAEKRLSQKILATKLEIMPSDKCSAVPEMDDRLTYLGPKIAEAVLLWGELGPHLT